MIPHSLSVGIAVVDFGNICKGTIVQGHEIYYGYATRILDVGTGLRSSWSIPIFFSFHFVSNRFEDITDIPPALFFKINHSMLFRNPSNIVCMLHVHLFKISNSKQSQALQLFDCRSTWRTKGYEFRYFMCSVYQVWGLNPRPHSGTRS